MYNGHLFWLKNWQFRKFIDSHLLEKMTPILLQAACNLLLNGKWNPRGGLKSAWAHVVPQWLHWIAIGAIIQKLCKSTKNKMYSLKHFVLFWKHRQNIVRYLSACLVSLWKCMGAQKKGLKIYRSNDFLHFCIPVLQFGTVHKRRHHFFIIVDPLPFVIKLTLLTSPP